MELKPAACGVCDSTEGCTTKVGFHVPVTDRSVQESSLSMVSFVIIVLISQRITKTLLGPVNYGLNISSLSLKNQKLSLEHSREQ